jgi:hypothetical protein
MSFVRLSPDDEDAIHDAVLALAEEATIASVLMVDSNTEVCRALRETIGRLGRRAFAVSTPLEAVHTLEGPQ